MCGIAGIISEQSRVEAETIEKMVAALRHRGPDSEGIELVDDDVGFGHSRLSIIDLQRGDQPMSSHDKRFWITYNGEIYNYKELKKDLGKRGCSFRTRSDTEVILEAYRHYGKDCVYRLDGMFSFGLWDRREKRFFAARDPFGKKPFYYAFLGKDTILFASEIKALFASRLIQGLVDTGALIDYLRLLYIPPFRTAYQNIETLPPGNLLTWQKGKIDVEEYWYPRFGGREKITEEEAVEEIRRLMSEAVKKRMLASDVPVGAFLSGGLDSSAVVALMSREGGHPVKTFSVGFGNLINELPKAHQVAELYRTDHHEVQMDIDVADMLEEMSSIYDEPFTDSSNIPTHLISKFAREKVKVVLSGDGGDELFGGYTWWYDDLLEAERINNSGDHRSPSLFVQGLARRLKNLPGPPGRHFEKRYRYLLKRRKALNLARNFENVWDRHLFQVDYFGSNLYDFSSTDQHFEFEKYHPAGLKGLDQAFYFDARFFLPGDILVKVDRASMANGLEVRAPLLDRQLTEFAFSLPPEYKFKDGQSKYIYRQAITDLLPESLLEKPKQGFGAPVNKWLRHPKVSDLALDMLQRKGNSLWNIISQDKANYHINRFYGQNIRSEAFRVWTILSLMLWEEKWRKNLLWA